jgi:hypothetical protein
MNSIDRDTATGLQAVRADDRLSRSAWLMGYWAVARATNEYLTETQVTRPQPLERDAIRAHDVRVERVGIRYRPGSMAKAILAPR